MDEQPITPRRSLPPVPPVGRSGATRTLAPAERPPDHTSWFDPLDPMNDSTVHPAFGVPGTTEDRTASRAALDLMVESGRQIGLDPTLLAALDAAARAAEARRAVGLDLSTTRTGAGPAANPTPPVPAQGLAAPRAVPPAAAPRAAAPLAAAPRAAAPLAPAPLAAAQGPAAPAATPAIPVPSATTPPAAPRGPAAPGTATPPLPTPPLRTPAAAPDAAAAPNAAAPSAATPSAPAPAAGDAQDATALALPPVDVAAEFARHDDLVETGRHAAVDDDDWAYDSGRHVQLTETGRHVALYSDDEHDDAPGTGLTHRTVITRSSRRRWIPAGVGAGVLAIVAAVLLTSGFAPGGQATGTDEAARTGENTTAPTAPAVTTPAMTTPPMTTIDLSGTTVLDTGVDDEDTERPSASTGRSTPAGQPQVAAPPAAGGQVVTGGGAASSAALTSPPGSSTGGAGGGSTSASTSTTTTTTSESSSSSDPGAESSSPPPGG